MQYEQKECCLLLSPKVLGSGCHSLWYFPFILVLEELRPKDSGSQKTSFPLLLISEKNSLPPFEDVIGVASEVSESKDHLSHWVISTYL